MAEFDKLVAANILKDEGNVLLGGSLSSILPLFISYFLFLFLESKYSLAAEKYSEAINLCPTAVFFSNRAFAMIKMESYGSAISDANEAITLDPAYIKAYYR